MSSINDRDLMTYAMREALAREKHLVVKLKEYHGNSRDANVKKLCSELGISCESRINIIRDALNNLYIRQE
jgi:hypothetical protein